MTSGTADVVLDTDVLIDHIRGFTRLESGPGYHYSVVTRCELFAGRVREEEAIRRLLASMTEVPVDRRIAELAGRLRRGAAIRTPDALIAATALTVGLPLRTHNRRDFDRIADLRLV